MRILHAIQELRTGGAERVVVALAKGAQAAGHQVAVASAEGALVSELDGPHYPLPLVERRLSRLPGAIFAVRRAVHRFRPGPRALPQPGHRGRGRARRRSAAGARPGSSASTAFRTRTTAARRRCSGSPGCRSWRAARESPSGSRRRVVEPTATILNGVSPAPPPADRAALAKEWGIAPDRPLLLTVGRLVPVKNQELAIRALAEVDDATLAIVGEGPSLDALRRAARDAGVEKRVVFAGLRPDARELIGAADAVVLPSRAEGLPLVALEALAAGTPLVATAVRGVRELVDDSTALLAPPDDPAALAAELSRVLADKELAERLSRAGLELAARHSEETMVAAYLDLYDRVANVRRP